MKKSIFITLLLLLSACAEKYTPDFVLKHTNEYAYRDRVLQRECDTYQQKRTIQVDGVISYYDYTSNNGQACLQVQQQSLDTYQEPNRYGRDDVEPLTR